MARATKKKPARTRRTEAPSKPAASSNAPAAGSIVQCALPRMLGRWRVDGVEGNTVRIANAQRGLVARVPRSSITLCES